MEHEWLGSALLLASTPVCSMTSLNFVSSPIHWGRFFNCGPLQIHHAFIRDDQLPWGYSASKSVVIWELLKLYGNWMKMSLLRAPIAISKNSLSAWLASCESSLSSSVDISHDNICNLLPFQKPLHLAILIPISTQHPQAFCAWTTLCRHYFL